jgi:hypothetical protein
MSMTLQQIIDMVNEEYPTSKTDLYLCGKLDNLQRSLYRKFDLPEEIEKIETVSGQVVYNLPEYIVPERIKSVVVTDSAGENPAKYYFKSGDDILSGNCYLILETDDVSMIILYPEPTTTGDFIIITFEDGPNTLSSGNMLTVPRLAKDYHEKIFVRGLKTELAKLRKDVDMANNFDADFQEGLKEALSDINNNGPGHPVQAATYW